jgi:hypothetical protein
MNVVVMKHQARKQARQKPCAWFLEAGQTETKGFNWNVTVLLMFRKRWFLMNIMVREQQARKQASCYHPLCNWRRQAQVLPCLGQSVQDMMTGAGILNFPSCLVQINARAETSSSGGGENSLVPLDSDVNCMIQAAPVCCQK